MRDADDILPIDIAESLLNGAQKVDEAQINIRAALSKADVVWAQQLARSHAESLDIILERVLDMQSSPEARIPPPYRYFQSTIEQMDRAFPFDLDDPIETPEVLAFQGHLKNVDNPWRR